MCGEKIAPLLTMKVQFVKKKELGKMNRNKYFISKKILVGILLIKGCNILTVINFQIPARLNQTGEIRKEYPSSTLALKLGKVVSINIVDQISKKLISYKIMFH